MINTLNQFKERLANDQIVLNSIREVESKQHFEDLLIRKSNEWGFILTRQVIHNELFSTTPDVNFEISREQIDANPSYTEFSGCTDNSNFTAQRPSACLRCT